MIEKYLTTKVYKDLKKEVYKKSYYHFFKDAYKALHPGEIYLDNWHIKYLCDRLQKEAERITENREKGKDIIINMPFRSAKSLIVTVVFPVWCWTINPKMKFICTSYSGDLSNSLAQKSRDLINTMWFQEFYGTEIMFTDDGKSKQNQMIKGGGVRVSAGMRGTITGKGADIIIVDDPQNPEMSKSEKEIHNVQSFYKGTLYNRLNQPDIGVRIIVMQRLNEEDLTGHLLDTNKEDFDHICLPVDLNTKEDEEILSPKEVKKYYIDNLFWHNRFTPKVIKSFYKVMGSQEVAGQLYQRPAPQEGNMIRRDWFEIVEPSSLTRDAINEPLFFYLDTAETEKQENDATAILVCFKRDNILYIANVVELRKEFFELVKYIPEFCRVNEYTENSMVKIEPKSSGKSIVSQLRKSTMLNVVELPTPKDDKISRVNSATPIMESRRVKLIKGAYIDNFLQQVTTFPFAAHDDMVDVLIHAIQDNLARDNFDYAFI